jgi:hypothetical protein
LDGEKGDKGDQGIQGIPGDTPNCPSLNVPNELRGYFKKKIKINDGFIV